MLFQNLSIGSKAPDEINVVIEIAAEGPPVKYEIDKATGRLAVDRFLSVAMHYPCNYGFIPQTIGGDQDPLDALVIASYPIQPGAIIKVRPIGVLLLEDEAGQDEKIITVPLPKIDPNLAHIRGIDDLADHQKQRISHFFARYKDLESEKWVKIKGFAGIEQAKDLINQTIVKLV